MGSRVRHRRRICEHSTSIRRLAACYTWRCAAAKIGTYEQERYLETLGKCDYGLQARYLRRDPDGRLAETPEEMCRRVASAIAQAETRFSSAAVANEWQARYFEALDSLDFLPNSPTLMNAGTAVGQLSACFVLPVEDSMAGIFESLKLMALIQQAGGGTGFSFSRLRPKGDLVATSGGTASGPVSFMEVFDCATENIRFGGRRRGANIGVLRVDHPDIEEFVAAKLESGHFRNFNLSVAVPDSFLEAAERKQSVELRHPRTNASIRRLPAADLLHKIANTAWQSGDPGLLFIDAINRHNPTPALGSIEATNPCGEVPLLPYEACNLGSINLSRVLKQAGPTATIDWDKLRRIAELGVRFLDDVIEAARWPAQKIEEAARGNRKIGLGVMGFAEMLILLGIPYGSPQSIAIAREVMQFVHAVATSTSNELARQRGNFPNWGRSAFAQQERPMRNATRTSIAPTGTLSIIAGTSASIEPLFALAYRRENVLGGQTLTEVNPLFMKYARECGLATDEILQELARRGSLAGGPGITAETKALFRTALELTGEEHLAIQAAFQEFVDNSVAKTVNLPHEATADDVAKIYLHAWKLGLKGITVYRYGSKDQQVLKLGTDETVESCEHFARCDPHACRL
jgi:ribonucleoside-diphosphate reductase alpha chain